MRNLVLLTAALATGCAITVSLSAVRAPPLGRALAGTTIGIPAIADDRVNGTWCDRGDGTRLVDPRAAAVATDVLRMAMQDAGARVVEGTSAPFALEARLLRAEGGCEHPEFEFSVRMTHDKEQLWSGHVSHKYDAKDGAAEWGAERAAVAISKAVEEMRQTFVAQLDADVPTSAGRVSATIPRAFASLKVARRMVVLPLRTVGDVPQDVARLLGNYMLSQLDSVAGLKTVGKDDMEAVLGVDKQRQALGCDQLACMAELGGALGADLVLHGEVGRLGPMYDVNLSVLRTRDASVVARASMVADQKEEALVQQLPTLVSEIVAKLNR